MSKKKDKGKSKAPRYTVEEIREALERGVRRGNATLIFGAVDRKDVDMLDVRIREIVRYIEAGFDV